MNKLIRSLISKATFIGMLTTIITSSPSPVLAAGGPVADGMYEIRTKLDTGYVLDVAGPSLDNYATLQLWEDVNVENQRFKVVSDGCGYYTITSSYSGKVLDTDGYDIFQNSANGSDTQKWAIKSTSSSGYYYLINKSTQLYADVDNAYADCGTNVKMFVRNDGYDAQKWAFSLLYEIEPYRNFAEDPEPEPVSPAPETPAVQPEAPVIEPVCPEPKPAVKEYTITYIEKTKRADGSEKIVTKKSKITNEYLAIIGPMKDTDEYEFFGYYSMEGCSTGEEAMKKGVILNAIDAGNEKDITVYGEYRAKNKAETKPQPEVKPEPKPEPAPQPEVKPEPKPEPVPQPEVKPEVKPEPKPEPAPQPEPSTKGDISKVLKEIPIGTTWNNSTEYKGTYGCFAFAKKAFKIMYGVDCASAYTGSKKYNYGTPTNLNLVSRLAETDSSVTAAQVKDTLIGCQAGDILQVGRYSSNTATTTTPHTMVVESVSDSGVTVIHGNYNGKVARTYFTWESFKKNYLKNPNNKAGVGVSVYRYKGK